MSKFRDELSDFFPVFCVIIVLYDKVSMDAHAIAPPT